MKKSLRLASILVLALFAIVPRPLPSQEVDADAAIEFANHMHEHLNRITAIKSSIVRDDLQGVREPASWIAEHDSVPGLPSNYAPYVELMRVYARQVVAATDIKSAAESVSRMARTCGNCHLVNHVDLEFGFDTRPGDGPDTLTHMQRHQWAVDRLWEGLIGPSDVAWSRGAKMLVDVPLSPVDFIIEATDGKDMAVLDETAHRVHVLGGQGTNIRTPDARSALYGELLGLCAGCHTTLGRGPRVQ
jgi:cytochrome c553